MTLTGRMRSAANARSLGGPLVRAAYPIEVWGVHLLPTRGPLIIAGDHPEFLAASAVKAVAPRPLHSIATLGVAGLPPAVQRAMGDIPVEHPGIGAAAEAIDLLAEGAAVLALGGLPSLGYLAAASGAPVATVVVLGAAGRVPTDPPALRTRIEVRFGAAAACDATGDPVSMATIRAVGEQIRQRVADAQAEAYARHGGR